MIQLRQPEQLNAWIPIIGTLLGVLIGGLVSVLTSKMQFERERRWKRDLLVQDKLLEIAELAEDVQRKLGKLYGDAVGAVESGQSLKPDSDPLPLARLKMLINYCAPELRPHMERVIQIRDELSPFVGEVLMFRDRAKPERQQLNLQLVRGIKQITSECKGLAEAAAESAQRRLGIGG